MKNEIENKNEIVEIVESEDFKNTLINLEVYRKHIDKINNAIRTVANNFLQIGKELALVKKDKSYVIDGYKDIYEFASSKFGFGVTSTKNFINVYTKFATKDDSYYAELKNEYKDYSLSQLIELLPVSEEEMKKYNPGQTVDQIRDIKKMSQLSDQDDKYIKEFNKMSERIKSLFIEKLKLKSISSEITFDTLDMKFEDTFSFEYDEKRYNYKFMLQVDYNHNLDYEITHDGYHTGYIYADGNNFVTCDGGSLNTGHRNFIKKFLIRENLLSEQ